MARDQGRNMAVVKTLTYLMFTMFAMTTDSVGLIIPEVIRTFGLSLTAAGTFQCATMAGIAVAALLFGQLADRLGRRPTIVVGLVLFASACFLMVTGGRLVVFAILLGLSGIAIGVFKTGALALIGDIATSTAQHTTIMNMAEGFFGVGAILGPGHPHAPVAARPAVAVALPRGRVDVRLPDRAGPAREISEIALATGRAASQRDGARRCAVRTCWPSRRARSCMSGSRPPSTCGCRPGSKAIPATRRRLRPTASRSFSAARRRPLPWRVAAQSHPVAGRAGTLQRRHTGVLRDQHRGRPRMGRLSAAAVGTVHVGDLSHLELQGHQLPPEVRARRRRRRDPLLHLCLGRGRPLAIGAVGDVFGHIVYGFWLATGFAVLLFAGGDHELAHQPDAGRPGAA